MKADLRVGPGVIIPADDLEWSAVRAAGPGGQHVNKVSTKVELRFDLRGTEALTPTAKARLRRLAGQRVGRDGWLVVTSQETRSQRRNLEHAREKLAELVRKALIRPKTRRKTKPTAASKRRRVEDKRHRSEKKRLRSRVRDDR